MEAPLSLTETTATSGRSRPRTKTSVSRPAVPLPTATASRWYFRTSSRRTLPASSRSRSDRWRKTTVW